MCAPSCDDWSARLALTGTVSTDYIASLATVNESLAVTAADVSHRTDIRDGKEPSLLGFDSVTTRVRFGCKGHDTLESFLSKATFERKLSSVS